MKKPIGDLHCHIERSRERFKLASMQHISTALELTFNTPHENIILHNSPCLQST